MGWPSPHSPRRTKDGFDQAIEKNHAGPWMWTFESSELTMPNDGWKIQTKIMDEATTGTIDGM